MCLPSDALLQHLPSYLGFSYLGRGVSLHGCSSKAQPLLLTLDESECLKYPIPKKLSGLKMVFRRSLSQMHFVWHLLNTITKYVI